MTSADRVSARDGLLEHQAFLRRLARSLVADPHRADDLLQDAAVIALERPPTHGGSLRGWLARVVRARAIDTSRSEQSRRARELGSPLPAPPRTAEETEAHLQVQRRVFEAVARLEEPYRTTILLRYYHDLGPSAIAAELGVPVPTIKSRLARGLAKLREDLDDTQPEGGRAWALVLAGGLGEAWRPAGATALATGGIVMGAKVVLGAVVAGGALVVGGWWLLRPGEGPQAPHELQRVALSTPRPLGGTDVTLLQEPQALEARSPLQTTPTAPAREGASAETPAWSLALALTGWSDADARPIAIEVRPGLQAEEALSVTRELAAELTLDVGAVFADAAERPGQLAVRLDHPAYLPASAQVLVPQELLDPAVDSGRLEAAIELVRAKAIVTGSVEIEGNETDVQARVAIFALNGGRPASEPIETSLLDGQGHFRLRADDAERHAVLALDERSRARFARIPGQGAGPGLRPDTRVLALERGEERDLGVLVLGEGLSIQGRVVGLGESLPASGQVRARLQGQGRFLSGELSWMADRFELSAQAADWGEDGSFRLAGLGPHAYRLSAMPGDMAERNIDMSFGRLADEQVVVTAPAEGVLLTLDRICVTVEVLGEGLPLEGASLGLFHDEEESSGWESWTFADAEGRVTLELDPRRGLHVEARDLRYGSKELRLRPEELLASDRFVIELEGPPVEPATLVVEPVVSDPALLGDLRLEVYLYDIARTPPDLMEHAREAAAWGNHLETTHLLPAGPFPTLSREGEARVIADLAAGTYLVRLLPQTAEPDGLCFLLEEAFEVELPPGARVVHDWRPGVGGVVRLSFTGTGDVRRASLLSSDEQELSVNYHSRGPTPDSRRVGGSPELSGVSVVHPALPPELYLLRLRMGDRTDRTIPIQVEPGRVTDVVVDLGAL